MWLCFRHHWLLCDCSIGMCQRWPHRLTPLFQALPVHPQPADQGTHFSSLLRGSKVRGPTLGSCCVSRPALEPLIQACTHFQLLSLSPSCKMRPWTSGWCCSPHCPLVGHCWQGGLTTLRGTAPPTAVRLLVLQALSLSLLVPAAHPKPSFGFQYLFSLASL